MTFLPGFEPLATTDDLGLDDLERHLPRTAYFDIETDGLGKTVSVTMIAALLGDRIEIFTRQDSLTGFLALAQTADLLVSFNGAHFDEPKLLELYGIPHLPKPHLDLRKLCKARSLTGGLKQIEKQIGLHRPLDIIAITGEDADWMWRAWEKDRDPALHRKLLRYAAADVIALRHLSAHLLGQPLPENPWTLLDTLAAPPPIPPATMNHPPSPASGAPRRTFGI